MATDTSGVYSSAVSKAVELLPPPPPAIKTLPLWSNVAVWPARAAVTLPEFALLRGDPRVKALRKKVGLPE